MVNTPFSFNDSIIIRSPIPNDRRATAVHLFDCSSPSNRKSKSAKLHPFSITDTLGNWPFRIKETTV